MDTERPIQPHFGEILPPATETDERDACLRVLRYASIQLTKFWVEIQSFPVFLNALNHASVAEVEGLLGWLQSSPTWNSQVENPELIQALQDADARRSLLQFSRHALCVRALRAELGERLAPPAFGESRFAEDLRLLQRCVDVVKRREGTDPLSQAELAQEIQVAQMELDRVNAVRIYFRDLQSRFDMPEPTRPDEAALLFRLLEQLEGMPARVVEWRIPSVIHPTSRMRMETWRDRARPILDQRQTLARRFRVDGDEEPEHLRSIAESLRSGGWFKFLNPRYRKAVKDYREKCLDAADLKKNRAGGKNMAEESRLEMSESLDIWARTVEQLRAFSGNAEARLAFGSRFEGVDTDFEGALLANAWAQEARRVLGNVTGKAEGTLAERLVSYLFEVSEGTLEKSRALAQSPETARIQGLLLRAELRGETPFDERATSLETLLRDWRNLSLGSLRLGLLSELPLTALHDALLRAEEIDFLQRRMEADPLPRQWLKTAYRGVDTRLEPIDQAMSYVRFIESAPIPDGLKKTFLSHYGPQRLSENRALVAPALHSLGLVKEHLGKVEVATRGRFQAQSVVPIPVLTQGFQDALKPKASRAGNA